MTRGKIPSLLSMNNGKPNLVEAKQAGKCKRCSAPYSKGSYIAGLPVRSSGFTNEKRYCSVCIVEIIIQTQTELDEIKGIFSV
jgi:hypothetical protein